MDQDSRYSHLLERLKHQFLLILVQMFEQQRSPNSHSKIDE
ncbi:MAG: hypothetical protein AB4041_15040 [Microcystaceae cyanobacterium]